MLTMMHRPGCLLALVASLLCGLACLVPARAAADESPESALAKLQDPSLRSSLTSFEEILGLLRLALGPESGEVEDKGEGRDEQRRVGPTLDVRGSNGEPVEVSLLVELANLELNKCNEDYFRLLVDWRKQLQRTPLACYVRSAITQQRRFCERYLDEQVESRLESFSETSRENLRNFLELDRIGHDFYVSPESSIAKLREIVDLHQDAHSLPAANALESCAEISRQLEDLVPIRRDHDIFARLPMTCDRYFRAYEFCRQLVDLNFSEELSKSLFLDVSSRTQISRFGSHLVGIGPETSPLENLLGPKTAANSDHLNHLLRPEQPLPVVGREQVVGAAREFLRERTALPSARLALTRSSQLARTILTKLKSACESALELTDNLRWLRRISLASPQDLTPRAREYLWALEGCRGLADVPVEELLPDSLKAAAAGPPVPVPKSSTNNNNNLGQMIMSLFGRKSS